MKKRTLLVVDGLGLSGSWYAKEARELFGDVKVVHLQSAKELPPGYAASFRPDDYDERLVYDGGNFDEILERLRRYPLDSLRSVAGNEPGVELNDRVSEALGIPSNGTARSAARRDKKLMAAAVDPFLEKISTADVRIRAMPGETFTEARAALRWIKETGLRFPILVKPVASASSFGLHVCADAAALTRAIESTVGVVDPIGAAVGSCIVQPYIENGTVIGIDTASSPEFGIVIASLLQNDKRHMGDTLVYECNRLVRYDETNARHRFYPKIAEAVAKALEIRIGPLHIEAIDTGKEIFVFDVGARPAGGLIPQAARACGANDQMTMSLLAAFEPARFRERAVDGPILPRNGVLLKLISEVEGVVESVPSEEEFRERIPGFVWTSPRIKPGYRLAPTTSLFDQPGIVFVQGTEAVLADARRRLREWEASGLYRLVPR